jgi:hypothetical protein
MNLQKLRLGQLKPADGATTLGDVYYPQTVLLAPFEGTNGSTSTSDLSTRLDYRPRKFRVKQRLFNKSKYRIYS